LIAHGFKEPALRSPRAQNAAASTASLPASVTIAIRPSVGWDGKSSRSDLGWMKTEIFLQMGLDTDSPDGQFLNIALCREPLAVIASQRIARMRAR
jgi:hypothetical protein